MAKRGPGKFDSDLDAALYALSLDGGPDEEVGSSTEAPGTWAGLMRDGAQIAQALEERLTEPEFSEVRRSDLNFLREDGGAGVIICESSSGAVDVAYYSDRGKLDADWADCLKDLSLDDEFEENQSRRRNTKLPKGYTKYGAQMGRRSGTVEGKARLERVRLDTGGYDSGGAYWGSGEPLWRAEDEDGNEEFFRAPSREAAVAKLGHVTVERTSGREHGGDEDSKLETDGTLLQLLEAQAEAQDVSTESLEVTPELCKVARDYEAALWPALSELVATYPPKGDADANDLMEDGDAPYTVYMTLIGAGVGIDDGRWDAYYDDTEKAESFLKTRLQKWAGKLESALDNAVYENDQGSDREENPRRRHRRRRNGSGRFRVSLNGEVSDTVYFDEKMSESEVRRSLIDHDGYDPRITVKKVEPRRTGIPAEAYVENRRVRRL